MSQHDMVIANQGFAALRADLNLALLALVSLSAGTSAPASPTTHQFWLDTAATPYILKYYDGTDWLPVMRFNATTNLVDSQTLFRPIGFVSGLTMSNAADTDHDITVAAGAIVDSAGSYFMALTSAMTKQIDAAWAVGTNAGGLFSGAVANSTWYHVFVIRKDSDGSIDVGFDTSVTAANKPGGYSNYKRIGSVFTNGSANINQFRQVGRMFFWVTFTLDLSTNSLAGTTWTSFAITVPPDVRVAAFGTAQGGNGVASESGQFTLSGTDLQGTTPAADAGTLNLYPTGGSGDRVSGAWGPIITNTSRQIAYYSGSANTSGYVATRGWIDELQ